MPDTPRQRASRRATLRRLRRQHALSHADIAREAGVGLDAVMSWFRRPEERSARCIPAPTLELLRLKLAARQVAA